MDAISYLTRPIKVTMKKILRIDVFDLSSDMLKTLLYETYDLESGKPVNEVFD